MAVKDMYLNFQGTVKGEAQATGHEDQVEIDDFSWGVRQDGDLHKGTGGGRGKAVIYDVRVRKSLDSASADLLKLAISLKHVPSVTLICRESAGDSKINYMEFEMKEVYVTELTYSKGEGSGKPTENLTLQFANFNFKYNQQDNTGAVAATHEVGYDIKKQELS